jgi:hypothetical protein
MGVETQTAVNVSATWPMQEIPGATGCASADQNSVDSNIYSRHDVACRTGRFVVVDQ